MDTTRFAGLRASIIGVAREGTALARFLASVSASVTLSDLKRADQLSGAVAALEGLPIRLALGGYPDDLLDVDLLFLSPGVPLEIPIVQEARRRGLPISSEPRLFLQLFPNRVVGITGSSGKTTTTTLIGQMLKESGVSTWVGGNIGQPLIGELAMGQPADCAVMELSSFQLELFHPGAQGEQVEERRSEASRVVSLAGWSPQVAVVTNITPNHLDRHGTMDAYIQAKSAIVAYQGPDDCAVLNADEPTARSFSALTPGRTYLFSMQNAVPQGAWCTGAELSLDLDGRAQVICTRDQVQLKGEHNLANMLAAACAAHLAGADLEAIGAVARTFQGVAHRLEVVRRWQGITFINDSIATTPERAMAAIRAFSEPLVLLAGGRDKHLPWDDWAQLVGRRVRAVVSFGECAPLVADALRRNGVGSALYPCDGLAEAVARAAEVARAGDVVLLSPGGTSFDAFVDFEARGELYRALVQAL